MRNGRIVLCVAALGVMALCIGCGTPEVVRSDINERLMIEDTPKDLQLRRLLSMSSPTDSTEAETKTLAIMTHQGADGSWQQDPTATGRALLDLYALNLLSRTDKEIVAAKDFILNQDDASYAVKFGADSPVWGQDWVAFYALNLWGFGDDMKIRVTVHNLLDNTAQWFQGQDGRAASVILRAISCHPLLQDQQVCDQVISRLAAHQRPDGLWDLGPGTSQFTIIDALLHLSADNRVPAQITRAMPRLLTQVKGERQWLWRDSVLAENNVQLVFYKALKLIDKLKPFLKGEGEQVAQDLAPYEVGLFRVIQDADKGHQISYKPQEAQDQEALIIDPLPIVLGPELQSPQEVLPPEKEGTLLRFTVTEGAGEKLQKLLESDQTSRIAFVLGGDVVAVEPLCDLLENHCISIRSLSLENSARLAKAVGRTGSRIVPAMDPSAN